MPSAPTVDPVKTGARAKTVVTAASASPARTPTWAACASASRAHAPQRQVVSPIRCAPASIRSVDVVAAMVAVVAMATAVAEAARVVVMARVVVARPIRCAPASVAFADLEHRPPALNLVFRAPSQRTSVRCFVLAAQTVREGASSPPP
jgi:hypothetical protein